MVIEAELALVDYVENRIQEIRERLSDEEYDALEKVMYEIGFNRGAAEELYRKISFSGFDRNACDQVVGLERKNGELVKACCECLQRNGFE